MLGSIGVLLRLSAYAMVEGCRQDGLASNLCSKVKNLNTFFSIMCSVKEGGTE